MIITVFFLAFFAFFAIVAFAAARSDITGSMSYDGPGAVANKLRQRNRLFVGGILVVAVVLGLLEVLVPVVHLMMMDLQYVVGDALGSIPAGVFQLTSGGGLSWGLYLSVVLATYAGSIIGAWGGCKQYPPTSHLGLLKLA